MYPYVDGTDKLVYKEKATIQLSEEMWNPRQVWTWI